MHLVLDLDETLISVSLKPVSNPDFTFIINSVPYYGRKRPGLDLFLKFAFSHFDTISVWTAATRSYAIKVIKNIMTETQYSALAFFKTRVDLVSSQGSYYKPLSKIFTTTEAKKYKITPKNTIMIDDRADVLRNNPGNGIMIPPWKGVQGDMYLCKLIIVLNGVLENNILFGDFGQVIDLTSIVD